jgi:short-subunit dehydrogenase
MSTTTLSEAPVLIIGATSGIAQAVAHRLASQGTPLVLAARNESELQAIANDLKIRYEIKIKTVIFEALDFEIHQQVIETCWSESDMQGVVVCHGSLPDQQAAQADWSVAQQALDINFTSVVSVLEKLAAKFIAQGQGGYLAVLSSVAGDRGRQSNYIYGAAKGGLSIYLQGLRNRLYHDDIHVLTVKPGFVYTAMTSEVLNEKSPLVASADQVARDICRAIAKRKNVIYTRWFWRCIMCTIMKIPEWKFKRMKM